MKTASEIKELQRQKYGAYDKAKEITNQIATQAEQKNLVFSYIHPEPINILVKEVLEEYGFHVQAKKDEITRQTVTEITW